MGRTKNLSKWLDWFYDEKENNFFFLCEHHKYQVSRPQDGSAITKMAKTMTCDFPGCKMMSDYEYFPHLFPKYKNYDKVKSKK